MINVGVSLIIIIIITGRKYISQKALRFNPDRTRIFFYFFFLLWIRRMLRKDGTDADGRQSGKVISLADCGFINRQNVIIRSEQT